MRTTDAREPMMVFVADLHISKNAPVARSAEPDWFEAIKRQWKPIADLGLPICIAGDIFDRWAVTPEEMHFAIELFSGLEIYAIPGQHDLPNHGYKERYRSGYGVLEACGAIQNMQEVTKPITSLYLHPFPWGHALKPCAELYKQYVNSIHIAVCHAYCWCAGHNFPGAPSAGKYTHHRTKLTGFDIAVFGDNHKGFIQPCIGDKPFVLNCGGFMPRKNDERRYTSYYGLLYSDGEMERYTLPHEKDKWLDETAYDEIIDKAVDMTDLVHMLEGLTGEALDFTDAVEQFIKSNMFTDGVRECIKDALVKG